jgi:glycosylphosphatidylinositol transamidase (GPIT) subunit GPI8
MTRLVLPLLLPLLLALSCVCGEEYHRHTNNWAVIVSAGGDNEC